MKKKDLKFPKISIITVTKNSEKYLEDSIKSVISQSYKNIEYIIIDGKSNDKTTAIIKKYEKYINYWKSENDNGLYEALNKGVKSSSGDYIGFLHSDDVFYDSNVIANIANEIVKNSYDFVYSNLKIVNENNLKKTIRFMKMPKFNNLKLKFGIIPPHPTIYYRKNLHFEVGYYDNNFKIAGDYDMILRFMLFKNISFKYINFTSVLMRSGGKSNRGILSKLKLNLEILRSAKKNNFNTSFFFLLFKIPFRLLEYIIKH